jgi:hypothetical protein
MVSTDHDKEGAVTEHRIEIDSETLALAEAEWDAMEREQMMAEINVLLRHAEQLADMVYQYAETVTRC